MKTQNANKLTFKKESVTELNDFQLNDVNGGATPGSTVIATTWVCFGITLVTAASAYVITQYDND